jgi:hypothetical protein
MLLPHSEAGDGTAAAELQSQVARKEVKPMSIGRTEHQLPMVSVKKNS